MVANDNLLTEHFYGKVNTDDNGMAAFFCDRPVHVFYILNFMINNKMDMCRHADIFVFDSFKEAEEISYKLKRENIFDHVFFVKRKRSKNNISKIKYIGTSFLSMLSFRYRFRCFVENELDNYVWDVEEKYINWNYTSIFTPSWGIPIWRKLACVLRTRCKVHFYDDGYFSYRSLDIIQPKAVTMEGYMRKLFKHGKYSVKIEKIFLNRPDVCGYQSMKISSLPAITGTYFHEIVKRVFNYKSPAARYILLDQNITEAKMLNRKNDIFKIIVNSLPKKDFIVRLHPAQNKLIINNTSDITIDEGKNLWEASLALGEITKENVLIGFYSTALVTPKLLFEVEPVIICLYRLLPWKDKKQFREIEQLFLAIKAKYKCKHRFIIVDNLTQLETLFKNI